MAKSEAFGWVARESLLHVFVDLFGYSGHILLLLRLATWDHTLHSSAKRKLETAGITDGLGGFLTNELMSWCFFFEKKLFAGVTAVSSNVYLIYYMRWMHIYSGEWPTIRDIVFASYYHLQKFSPWNFVNLIVFLPCHNVSSRTLNLSHSLTHFPMPNNLNKRC